MILRRYALVLLLAPLASGQFEVKSLLGRPLFSLPASDGGIQGAQRKLQADPENVSLIVALSKAFAARRQYQEAVLTCTRGLATHPMSPELFLEKGHRELGLREFDEARADLTRAVELAPLQLDGHYHLGLSYYFLSHFDKASEAFGHALDLAKTSDSLIDCSNWAYVSLRRAGQPDAAARVLARITPAVANSEPHLFFYLQLLHFYQGKISEEQILPKQPAGPDDIEGELSFDTIHYGVGNWYLYSRRDTASAQEHFKKVIAGHAWNAWGFIGSEIELSQKQ